MTTKITHIRWVEFENEDVLLPNSLIKKMKLTQHVLPQGGATVVRMLDGEREATGVAFCSNRDNFSKKIGRMIATGRARKQLELDPKFGLRRILEVSGKDA